jgi:hypothetical protein
MVKGRRKSRSKSSGDFSTFDLEDDAGARYTRIDIPGEVGKKVKLHRYNRCQFYLENMDYSVDTSVCFILKILVTSATFSIYICHILNIFQQISIENITRYDTFNLWGNVS